ncbi:MAG TPA: TolC family protein [Candidatus Sumerlaeota bacterium]|nr:TolC family protein [Candidatus Sumerlaeota bacterium]HOR26556.1 TolC family protein [Candidatus Sumerlaeota bacterium]HPK00881.1 TolC family protein [Candidatus Sumerlaeota bacterium]
MRLPLWLGLLAAIAPVAGCLRLAPAPYTASRPAPCPPGQGSAETFARVSLPEPAAEYQTLPIEAPTGVLTLADAINRALDRHPELAALEQEVAAREAEVLQADLPPNPELEAEIEDLLGGTSGAEPEQQDLSGFTGAEATLTLSQTIERAGKRLKRRHLAERQADAAAWDIEARRLELLTRVQAAFVELLAAQEKVNLARQLAEIATQAHETVARRVEAGKISPIEEKQSRVAWEVQRTDLAAAEAELDAARRRLAALWDAEPVFGEAVGDLERLPPLPAAADLETLLADNPEVARWATEMAVRRAALELAEAEARPDPTLRVGARYFNETENHALILGFSIPLPLFDRNQGQIAAARHRLEQAEAEQAAARRRLREQLIELHGRAAGARDEAERLRTVVLPDAQAVYESLLEGFWLGEYDLINVLDAQQRVFELRGRYLDQLTEFQQAAAELEGLIGAPLATVAADSAGANDRIEETKP